MDRRAFIGALAGGLVGAPLAAVGQHKKVPRIGYLTFSDVPGPASRNLVEGLLALGYAEGRDFTMEYRLAAGLTDQLGRLASDLVQAKVDVIVTNGILATIAAKNATATIPIVFGSAYAPVENGLVESLARPGKNVTGLAMLVPPEKVLELLKEAAPQVDRVVYLYDSAGSLLDATARELQGRAKVTHVLLQPMSVRTPTDIARALEGFAPGTNGLIVDNAGSLLLEREQICQVALARSLPAAGCGRGFAGSGCLLTYGEDFSDMYRRAATYVAKILKGAKPADLPVELATKFELVINLKTAKALGLTIRQSLLQRADQVIE